MVYFLLFVLVVVLYFSSDNFYLTKLYRFVIKTFSFSFLTFFVSEAAANARTLESFSDIFKSDNFQESLTKAVSAALSNTLLEAATKTVNTASNSTISDTDLTTQVILVLNMLCFLFVGWSVFSFKAVLSELLPVLVKIEKRLNKVGFENFSSSRLPASEAPLLAKEEPSLPVSEKPVFTNSVTGLPVINPQVLTHFEPSTSLAQTTPIGLSISENNGSDISTSLISSWDPLTEPSWEVADKIANSELQNETQAVSFYKDTIVRIQFYLSEQLPFLSESCLDDTSISFRDFLILKNLCSIMNNDILERLRFGHQLMLVQANGAPKEPFATTAEWPFQQVPINPFSNFLLELDLETLQKQPIGFFKLKTILISIYIYGFNSFDITKPYQQKRENKNVLLNKLRPLLDLIWVPQLTFAVLNFFEILVQPEQVQTKKQKNKQKKFTFTREDLKQCFLKYQAEHIFVSKGLAGAFYLKKGVLVQICFFMIRVFSPEAWSLVQTQEINQRLVKKLVKNIVDATLTTGSFHFLNMLLEPILIIDGQIDITLFGDTQNRDFGALVSQPVKPNRGYAIHAVSSLVNKSRASAFSSAASPLVTKPGRQAHRGFFQKVVKTRTCFECKAISSQISEAVGTFDAYWNNFNLDTRLSHSRFIISTLGDTLPLATESSPATLMLVVTNPMNDTNTYECHLLKVFFESLEKNQSIPKNLAGWTATYHLLMVINDSTVDGLDLEGFDGLSTIPLSKLLAAMHPAAGSGGMISENLFQKEGYDYIKNCSPIVFIDLYLDCYNQNKLFDYKTGLFGRGTDKLGFILPFVLADYKSHKAVDLYRTIVTLLEELITSLPFIQKCAGISKFTESALYVRYLKTPLANKNLALKQGNLSRLAQSSFVSVFSEALAQDPSPIKAFDQACVEKAHALVSALRTIVSNKFQIQTLIERFSIFASEVYNASYGFDARNLFLNLNTFFTNIREPSQDIYINLLTKQIIPGFCKNVQEAAVDAKKQKKYCCIPIAYIQTGAFIMQDFYLVEIARWFAYIERPLVRSLADSKRPLLRMLINTFVSRITFAQNTGITFLTQLSQNAALEVNLSQKSFWQQMFFPLASANPNDPVTVSKIMNELAKAHYNQAVMFETALRNTFLFSEVYVCSLVPYSVLLFLSLPYEHRNGLSYWYQGFYNILKGEDLTSPNSLVRLILEPMHENRKQIDAAFSTLLQTLSDNKRDLGNSISNFWFSASGEVRASDLFLASLKKLLEAYVRAHLQIEVLIQAKREWVPETYNQFVDKYAVASKSLSSAVSGDLAKSTPKQNKSINRRRRPRVGGPGGFTTRHFMLLEHGSEYASNQLQHDALFEVLQKTPGLSETIKLFRSNPRTLTETYLLDSLKNANLSFTSECLSMFAEKSKPSKDASLISSTLEKNTILDLCLYIKYQGSLLAFVIGRVLQNYYHGFDTKPGLDDLNGEGFDSLLLQKAVALSINLVGARVQNAKPLKTVSKELLINQDNFVFSLMKELQSTHGLTIDLSFSVSTDNNKKKKKRISRQ